MQIIDSYSLELGDIRFIQRLRLYHLSRPGLKHWRQTRHGKTYPLDETDKWILNGITDKNLVLVDCAGWYFEQFGVTTTCLESDSVAKYYWPSCRVEPDILIHRPTYISTTQPVVFKYPWFLKYATVDQFANFLNVWVKSTTIINFNPIFIQHNHLKYTLLATIKPMVKCNIQLINNQLWIFSP
jgi:hypothetical protein